MMNSYQVLICSRSILIKFRKLVLVGFRTEINRFGVTSNGIFKFARLKELVSIILFLNSFVKLGLWAIFLYS
jgi:hypothetical protein